MTEVVLALDQGTTGTTALVFSTSGEVLGRAYLPLAQFFPQPGWVEHDPLEIWRSSLAVMAAALVDAGVKARSVRAIGLTNQRETTIVWDRRSGRPIYPAIVWQSRQSADLCEGLRADGLEPLFRERTGLLLDPYFSGTKIRWILDRDPDFRRRAEAGELIFGTVDSWLLFNLTGGAVHRTEPTNASRTLLFNLEKRAWDHELIELIGIPPRMLPEVAASSAEVFGETGRIGDLPKGIPISGMAGDQQAALFGQGCWLPGQAKNTYGTGCFLLMNMGERNPTSRHGLLTTLGCDANGRPTYCLEGSVFSAGAGVQWLRDELQLIHNARDTEALARSVTSTDGVYFVPAFSGLGAPYWDMKARGLLCGLTRGSKSAHLVRAVLESIAYQTCDVLEAMNADSGVPIIELRVDGGAAANDFLMQFQADVAGIPVNRPLLVESTAAGAAFLAGMAVGFWADSAAVEEARRCERIFEPQLDGAARDALKAGWRRAVARALEAPAGAGS